MTAEELLSCDAFYCWVVVPCPPPTFQDLGTFNIALVSFPPFLPCVKPSLHFWPLWEAESISEKLNKSFFFLLAHLFCISLYFLGWEAENYAFVSLDMHRFLKLCTLKLNGEQVQA